MSNLPPYPDRISNYTPLEPSFNDIVAIFTEGSSDNDVVRIIASCDPKVLADAMIRFRNDNVSFMNDYRHMETNASRHQSASRGLEAAQPQKEAHDVLIQLCDRIKEKQNKLTLVPQILGTFAAAAVFGIAGYIGISEARTHVDPTIAVAHNTDFLESTLMAATLFSAAGGIGTAAALNSARVSGTIARRRAQSNLSHSKT